MPRLLSALLLLLHFTAYGRAEDFCCGSIFPTGKTPVRLTAEDVKLRFRGNQVEADCAYRLENLGEAAALELGLPFRAGAKAALGIGEDEPDSIRAVDLEMDGNDLESSVRVVEGQRGTAAYLWTLALEAQAEAELRLSYRFDLKMEDDGVSHLHYAWGFSPAWAAAEGAELDIDLGRPFPLCYMAVSPSPQAYENGHLHWSLSQTPATDVSVRLDQRRGDVFANLVKRTAARGLGVDEALVLKNTVFALRGKVFPSRSLNRHFLAQDWYRPRQDYSDKLLTPEEWEVVADLGRRVARAKGQKVPKR